MVEEFDRVIYGRDGSTGQDSSKQAGIRFRQIYAFVFVALGLQSFAGVFFSFFLFFFFFGLSVVLEERREIRIISIIVTSLEISCRLSCVATTNDHRQKKLSAS